MRPIDEIMAPDPVWVMPINMARYDAMETALKRVILWAGDWSMAQEIKRMCEEALND